MVLSKGQKKILPDGGECSGKTCTMGTTDAQHTYIYIYVYINNILYNVNYCEF
jgi:hypothetical protein